MGWEKKSTEKPLVLVTGATGYVGGRLVPRLLAAGYRVRVLARDPARVAGRAWRPHVQLVQGDVFDPSTLETGMRGVAIAYYLVHSMRDGADFAERDLAGAHNFGAAALRGGIERIIYLGGLGDSKSTLSPHLRSRQETGDALRASGVPVTEFRAAIIVGAGSISFEIIRAMTERVPIMICPRWVYVNVQPIAIQDVLDYLIQALGVPESAGRIIEIGGADVTTYGDMMLAYAKARQLRRSLIPVPVLTPQLSANWVHWMTPISAKVAHPLIEGLRSEVVVRDDAAYRLFPHIHPLNLESALRVALQSLEAGQVETAWSDALPSRSDAPPALLSEREGIIREVRQLKIDAPASIVYGVVSRLGGTRGWLYANWLWQLRGVLDLIVGGVGFRRGRRHPDELHAGDALDFWRVEQVEKNHLLRLRAEMRVPGLAWLEFHVQPETEGTARLIQTAYFVPKGLAGLVYWYGLYPLHAAVFSGLIKAIGKRAEGLARKQATRSSRIENRKSIRSMKREQAE